MPVQKKIKKEVTVKQEVKSKLPDPDVSKPVFTTDILTMSCTMHSTMVAESETVPLVAGPEGLLIAKFGDVVHTTELCNLMMFAAPPKKVLKKPAAALKKPAAAPIAEADVPIVPPVPPMPAALPVAVGAEAAPVKNDYGSEWYKRSKSIGIKIKFGAKNQVFSCGGARCTKTEEQMREFGKQIVADLHTGMSAADAKAKGMKFAFPD